MPCTPETAEALRKCLLWRVKAWQAPKLPFLSST
jgi:hypothetical protein